MRLFALLAVLQLGIVARGQVVSGTPSFYNAGQAFDQSLSTRWVSHKDAGVAELGYAFSHPVLVQGYTIKLTDAFPQFERAPRDFALFCNETDPVRVDYQKDKGIEEWARLGSLTFELEQPVLCTACKVVFYEDNHWGLGVQMVDIAELYFTGAPPSTQEFPGVAFGSKSIYDMSNLFDGDAASYDSAAGASPMIITAGYGYLRTFVGYELVFTKAQETGLDYWSRTPQNWQVNCVLPYGFVPSIVTLDSRFGQDVETWKKADGKLQFTIQAPRPCKEYQLVVTDDNDPAAGIYTISLHSLSFIEG